VFIIMNITGNVCMMIELLSCRAPICRMLMLIVCPPHEYLLVVDGAWKIS
jgi:hypothetical protein